MTTIINGSSPSITFSDSTTQTTAFTTTPVINSINSQSATPLTFGINGAEVGRFDTTGAFLVGVLTNGGIGGVTLGLNSNGAGTSGYAVFNASASTSYPLVFRFNGGTVGTVTFTNTGTVYSTSSDYRLKENVKPMTGALATVSGLKPVTYDWKIDGSAGQGFIAHELQAVIPQCVTGEKDAVDADGKPIYQGIDTSFLVATLTAAIQELKAEFDAYKASHP